jgi:mannose-6-phosphate isomerase-like protein (cupin superfamily)
MNRRDVLIAASAFATLGGLLAEAQPLSPQKPAAPAPDSHAPAADTTDMAHSRVFHFDQMPVRHFPNGGWGRQVMHGTLPTGEFVELHETMLPAGQMPHPPHRHRNTEFVLIREGSLVFYDNGKPEPCGPGDIVYTASNQLHGMKNVGATPALYFVVSVSHGQM